jgi:hypothetical protein
MTPDMLGNLGGRLAVSYLVIWLFMWLALSRRSWRGAFRCTHRWYGLTALLVTFSLGLFTATSS